MSNVIVLGQSGKGRKLRGFSAKEFREELIPEYVKYYYKYKNKETGEITYRYSDGYGENEIDDWKEEMENELMENELFEIERICIH